MDLKKINEQLDKILEDTSNEAILEDFVAFLKEKGFDCTIKPSSLYNDPIAYFKINDTIIRVEVVRSTIIKDNQHFTESIILADVGYGYYSDDYKPRKRPYQFNTIQEYYEYILDGIIKAVDKWLTRIQRRKENRQTRENQLNNLKNGETIEVNLQDFKNMIKELPKGAKLRISLL